VRRSNGFRIAGSARQRWERHSLPYRIEQVVDAFFALPDDQISEQDASTEFVGDWYIAHARVFGCLFMMGGLKNARGEWTVVRVVAPVWPLPPRTEESDV